MCGIAGIIFKDNVSEANQGHSKLTQFVCEMLHRIRHRGREEPITASFDSICIGCCRLPITDRYNGQQPVKNEDGDIITVFNGEIYNHIDLRIRLSDIGHRIITECDSEIIPHLYEDCKNSPESIHDDLNGMYAIATIDTQDKKVILWRDGIGKKPLFLLESAELIAFASEIKAFGIPIDKTVFGSQSRITELLPGETVTICKSQITHMVGKSRGYVSTTPRTNDSGTIVDSVRKCLTEAVRLRMPPDRLPIAILCSGGIDSAIITWLANEEAKARDLKITAYVIGTAKSPDIRAARSLCQPLEIPLREIIIDKTDLATVVSEVVYHTESFEPNIVRNSLISYLLFRRIRDDDHRIALCGEGADELFCGYADFEHAPDGVLLRNALLDDLFRTQLLRVDRTSMAFSVETRAPFLDRNVIRLASDLSPKLNESRVYGLWQGKAILREAFRDVLPWETVTRSKATLSYGAGFGEVSMSDRGPLESYAKRALGSERERLQRQYNNINLSTYERALYLYFFEQFYRVPDNYKSPTVAQVETQTRESKSITS